MGALIGDLVPPAPKLRVRVLDIGNDRAAKEGMLQALLLSDGCERAAAFVWGRMFSFRAIPSGSGRFVSPDQAR
jgi:hypothetical protein